MSERPTPDEIIALLDFHGILTPHMRKNLEGCVIVHPDDVPEPDDRTPYEYFCGWRSCHRQIFGGSHE